MNIRINTEDKTIIVYNGTIGEIIKFLKHSVDDWEEYTIEDKEPKLYVSPYPSTYPYYTYVDTKQPDLKVTSSDNNFKSDGSGAAVGSLNGVSLKY
jgi:hypothetical protein